MLYRIQFRASTLAPTACLRKRGSYITLAKAWMPTRAKMHQNLLKSHKKCTKLYHEIKIKKLINWPVINYKKRCVKVYHGDTFNVVHLRLFRNDENHLHICISAHCTSVRHPNINLPTRISPHLHINCTFTFRIN